ncbi:MAG TPA: hypothetical protein VK196_14260 [Magnetospirillum sp.]|nr:hypothetical protein [Magnetospirillum sp.]
MFFARLRLSPRRLPHMTLALLCLVPQAPAVAADPPPWSGAWQVHERYHRPDDGAAPVMYLPTQTESEADEAVPVARGLPYGFNRGTCDRSLLDAGLAVQVPASSPFGQAMAQADRECLRGALESLPDNRSISWQGENGALFRVSTERTYMRGGVHCRDWNAGAELNGRFTQTFGTFCRRSDGQWVSAK